MNEQLCSTIPSDDFTGRSTLVMPGDSEIGRSVLTLASREGSTNDGNSISTDVDTPGGSQAHKWMEDLLQYDIVSVFQLIESQNLRQHIKVTLPVVLSTSPIVGRGRIFAVRRAPTGWGDDQHEDNYFTPADAVKCLASSVRSGQEEEALRYRCLIQELRILLHEPIKKHPNFLNISELGWEPDPLRPNFFLPCLYQGFSVFGSLDSVIGAMGITVAYKRRFMLDVAEGLLALHKCGIAHSDVKMENVMVFDCEDKSFDMIAKITDFGFSMDINSEEQERKLIGCTPLWAAPEILEGHNNFDLVAADVYSLGFVIWGIAIDGNDLLKTIEELVSSTDIRNDWTSWKQSNELVSLACAQLHSIEDPGNLDVEEICHLISSVLQADLDQRNIHTVLHTLRGKCNRASDEEHFENLVYSPLPPFDHKAINLTDLAWRRDWLRPPLRTQIMAKLEKIASAPASLSHRVETINDEDWRNLPPPKCRATAAAFALGVAHMQGFRDSKFTSACHWFHLAGQQGHALSRAFFAKFAVDFRFGDQESEETANGWLRTAACNGSQSALSQLSNVNSSLQSVCIKQFRTFFWARAYGIPEAWISNILSMDIDWLSDVPGDLALGNYGTSLLQCAAMTGAHHVVNKILSTTDDSNIKAVVNKKNNRGDTALLLACKSGHGALVLALLEAGADTSLCNDKGENALHWLTSLDDDQIFDTAWALVSGGAQIEQSAQEDLELLSKTASQYFHRICSGTPLHRAARRANVAAIGALLSLGADPVVESWRFTPLCYAAIARCPRSLELLLAERPPSFNVDKLYPNLAYSRVSTTLSRAICVEKTKIHYFSAGLYNDNALLETLSLLWAAGARPGTSKVHAVIHCILHGEIAASEWLLNLDDNYCQLIKAPGNDHISNPLVLAIHMDDEHALDVLINAGASTTHGIRFGQSGNLSPFQLCCKLLNQGTECMERFLRLGIDVDVFFDREVADTALVYAVQLQQYQKAEFLIARGASLTKQSRTEVSRLGNVLALILQPCPDSSMLFSIELLCRSKELEIPLIVNDSENETVFHRHCLVSPLSKLTMRRSDWQAIFDLFLGKFPDPAQLNMQDRDGRTPLHNAVWSAVPVAVECLLRAGADATIPNKQGVTAVQVAREGQFRAIPSIAFFSSKHMDFYHTQMREVQQLVLSPEEAESAYEALRAKPSLLMRHQLQRHGARFD